MALQLVVLAIVHLGAAAMPVHAHHAMGGGTPQTLMQGLLSGLGHPVIGIDHLAFIVAMGVAIGAAGLSLAMPVLFIAASTLGVALHVFGIKLPIVELLVAASVLIAGAMLASGRTVRAGGWIALFALAGIFHGYAFGEAVVGAETTPLAAYLAGLAIVQAAIAMGVGLVAQRAGERAIGARLAGATVAGVGLAVLAGQFLGP